MISKKKVSHTLISQCHFDGFSAGPPEANGPYDGPPWSQWAPKGPGIIVPPAPPLVGPEGTMASAEIEGLGGLPGQSMCEFRCWWNNSVMGKQICEEVLPHSLEKKISNYIRSVTAVNPILFVNRAWLTAKGCSGPL